MARIDQLIRIKSELIRCMLSEFFGTFLLVFIAHSTGAAYGFASNGNDKVARIFSATFGIGCAALIALTATIPVSGGHINPAITVAVASMGHFPWSRGKSFNGLKECASWFRALLIMLAFEHSIVILTIVTGQFCHTWSLNIWEDSWLLWRFTSLSLIRSRRNSLEAMHQSDWLIQHICFAHLLLPTLRWSDPSSPPSGLRPSSWSEWLQYWTRTLTWSLPSGTGLLG